MKKKWERLGIADSPPAINFDGLCEFLHTLPFPLTIRIGGWEPGTLNPYGNNDAERDAHSETFVLFDNGNMNLAGFPVCPSGMFQPALIALRLGVERFQAAHKYHGERDRYFDNEYYTVVARVTPTLWELDEDRRREFEQALLTTRDQIRRDFQADPAIIAVEAKHCSLAKYRRTTLAKDVVDDVLSLADLTADKLRRLYN